MINVKGCDYYNNANNKKQRSAMKTPTADLPDTQLNPSPVAPQKQRHNPLHGLTLETIVTALVTHYGWAELAERIPINCFSNNPGISSSLKFLRKTPWARAKVEGLYGFMLRDINRAQSGD